MHCAERSHINQSYMLDVLIPPGSPRVIIDISRIQISQITLDIVHGSAKAIMRLCWMIKSGSEGEQIIAWNSRSFQSSPAKIPDLTGLTTQF